MSERTLSRTGVVDSRYYSRNLPERKFREVFFWSLSGKSERQQYNTVHEPLSRGGLVNRMISLYESTFASLSRNLLRLLGDFWTSVYENSDQIDGLTRSAGESFNSQIRFLGEVIKTSARQQVPVWVRREFLKIHLKKSDGEDSSILFGDEGEHFGGTPLRSYGQRAYRSSWKIDPRIKKIDLVLDDPLSPRVVFVEGIHYEIEEREGKNRIYFLTDPFFSEFADSATDEEDPQISLWLYGVHYDRRWIDAHWGYLLGFNLPSSQDYRTALNTVFDALTGGSSHKNLVDLLQGLTEVPVARKAETIRSVEEFNNQIHVFTDTESYSFPDSISVTVEAGDDIVPGQLLSDAYRIFELNRGEVPEWLSAFSIGQDLLAIPIKNDLIFVNQDQEWKGSLDTEGKLKVRFDLGGEEADVERFWEEVHRRGLERDQTLGDLLDQRPEGQITEVSLENLPTSVNPAEFLVQQLFRYNMVLVTLRVGLVEPVLRPILGSFLRLITPPSKLVWVIAAADNFEDQTDLEAEGESQTMILSVFADTTSPGRSRFLSIEGAC